MDIKNACQQYFNAYNELGNRENNDKWTNAGLLIEVISYFTLVAPLIVLAAYTTASLAGRIAQKFQLSSSDLKTSDVFQKTHDDKGLPTINVLKLIRCGIVGDDKAGTFRLNQLPRRLEPTDVRTLKAQLGRFPKVDHLTPAPDDLLNLTLIGFSSHVFTKKQIDELIDTFGKYVIDLLSEEQAKDFFGNLKAADMDQTLYESLFTDNVTATSKERFPLIKARFQLISEEEAAGIMKRLDGRPRHLLSLSQAKHFFGNLKAADMDQTLYESLFACDPSIQINKGRFKLVSKEEVAGIMKKFGGGLRHVLSEEQEEYFFGNLKADDVDQTLYQSLFNRDPEKTNKARLQRISEQERTALQDKFMKF